MLIAGTSIGGVIALGLALGKSADSIKRMFLDHGEEIFTKGEQPKGWLAKKRAAVAQYRHAKYDGSVLREKIELVVGKGARLGDARTRLLIPSINMTKGSVQMFKTAHHPNFLNDHKLSAVDVAMATSAAPFYFPMAKIENSHFIDGGIVANAPDICAVHEAIHFLKQDIKDINVLSIGTTTSKFSLPNSLGRNLGQQQWLENGRLVSTVFSAQQQLVDFMLKQQLGDRYVRFDDQPSAEQVSDLGLDLATEKRRETLLGMADGCYQALSNNPRVIQMLAHHPEKPIFYH
jgi:patatin-like phospholipase/acyl hydrolase